MAYIVLALGVLMSLIGLGAIASGYPVIEVERGWASVISGAVLLSGGLVTVSLGVVVRLLVGLKRSLQVAAVAAPAVEAASPALPEVSDAPAVPFQSGRQLPSSFAPPAVGTVSAVAVPVAAATGFAAEKMHEPEATPTAAASPPATVEPEKSVYEEAQPVEEHGSEHVGQVTALPGHEGGPTEPELSAPDELPVHEPPHAAEHETVHPPESDAWLEQAFQAFDYETSGHPSATVPAQPHAETVPSGMPEPANSAPATHDEPVLQPVEESQGSAPRDERVEAGHESGHLEGLAGAPEAPATSPDTAPDNLAVIGRYDSEGTSYVMYSDGSIEAQSDAGVYRFGSMAELKAFIEG